MVFTILFSILFATVGFMAGWLGNERYTAALLAERHEFDHIFNQNPHPEIFDKDGKIDKGDYMFVNFELGYDPDEFEAEDIHDDY